MDTWLQRLIDISSVARNVDDLRRELTRLGQDLGFEAFAYLSVQSVGTFAFSTYPTEWQRRYFEQQYAKIDPVVACARKRLRAFAWTSGSPRGHSSGVRRFYSEAADFGIRSGLTIPVRTAFGHMSMLTLASRKVALPHDKSIDDVLAASAVTMLHVALSASGVSPTASAQVELTARQALCLKWSAEGKSMKDIATIEAMSYATVNFHLNNARKALDAASLAQATAIATKMKLI